MIKRMFCASTLRVLLMSMFVFSALAARAQQAEAPKQPVTYTYVSFFGVPRAQWGAYEKNAASEHKVFDSLLAEKPGAFAVAMDGRVFFQVQIAEVVDQFLSLARVEPGVLHRNDVGLPDERDFEVFLYGLQH